jgi:hypothetical protein
MRKRLHDGGGSGKGDGREVAAANQTMQMMPGPDHVGNIFMTLALWILCAGTRFASLCTCSLSYV